MLIVARTRFAKATKHALVAINNNQRHAGGTATVIDMVGVTIDHIGGKFRVNDRLSCPTDVHDAAHSAAK